MRVFNVNAQVIHYVNGTPKKVAMVEQPYIYTALEKVLYIKSGDINNTKMSVYALHSKKAIGKELNHLRVLVDTSGRDKLTNRHKNMLDYLGLEDLEPLIREDGDGYPTIFMSISIFTNKLAEKEKSTLDSISFRFMNTYANKTDAVAISDWYSIKNYTPEPVSDSDCNNVNKSDTESEEPDYQNDFCATPILADRSEKEKQYSDIAERLEVLRVNAMNYNSNGFDPTIKDICFLSGVLEGLKEAIYRTAVIECCGLDAKNTPSVELDARKIYRMSIKFLYMLENQKTVEKDYFILLSEAINALDLRSICRRLVFGEDK